MLKTDIKLFGARMGEETEIPILKIDILSALLHERNH
jgi:hypothetical protein